MKNIIKLLSICFVCSMYSCSDLTFGDKFLGSQPESSGAVLDSMFNSKVNADKVLSSAYAYLPYGLPTAAAPYNKMGVNILEAITDLYQSCRNNAQDGPVNLYYNGLLSANNTLRNCEAYRYGSETQYNAIRYAWIYIENAARIPDISEAERSQRIAEAKMVIALSYAEMLRYVGGVPWIDHSIDPNEDMTFPRLTFAETVSKIVGLLDEAIPYLKWKQDEVDDGRMTKAGAMGLKLRVLLFAASPTFNSDTKWHSQADEYTCYGNFSNQRWEEAMKAGKAFFDELGRQRIYGLTQPTEDTHRAHRLAYRSGYYDRGGTEVLISTRRGYDVSIHQQFFDQRLYSGPTLNYVNMFPWSDGSDFPANFDWEHPSKQPFFENGEPTRDPRLYENVAVPGDNYFNDTQAPIYTNHQNYRAEGTGFLMMKFILQSASDRNERPVQWPYLRLPEVMLSYAEAINEFEGPRNAVTYVNQVRNRVGLSDLPSTIDKTTLREAILRERTLEFGFEEVHWFDLVRWGRKDDFQKKLYGLYSKGNQVNNPTSFTFSTYELAARYWVNSWDSKWYLAPIPQSEINKEYGMTQNPGW
ncbi:RagB/SusD family nutrient uptake outer membrane protein [Bacteroides timonensis]|uniref:RagB/SusD family nutrient uptake outer membrane protein n=1 Tax=Bacteroides timonensis TaxID=1470345 RepID=UPI0004B93A4E|nr:RagB/SusD family nutrient uptake outer membrane protein [Bacteroides timonensis]